VSRWYKIGVGNGDGASYYVAISNTRLDNNNMSAKNHIDNWVTKKESFYFFLPDGPYCRPFDNQYLVKEILQNDSELVLMLSGGINLRFFGDIILKEEGCNLLISGFKRCDFEINGKREKSYGYGEVALSGF
jgi:hypothetical protein